MRPQAESVDAELGHVPYTSAIVGVQKAATSTLYATLSRHRQISRSPKKEVHFFDDESLPWSPPDYSVYRCPRRKPRERAAIDATPAYLFWPYAMGRMRAYDADMRLIACFRDPVERAFSQWCMHRETVPGYPEFGQVIAETRPASLPADVVPARGRGFRQRSLVARGYYGAQLRRGLELFDVRQWLLLDFHRLFDDYDRVTDQMTDFLDLPRFKTYPTVRKRMAAAENLTGAPPTAADVEGLAELYESDLDEFARLSGLDVSHWSTSRVLDGTLDPADLAGRLAAKAGLADSAATVDLAHLSTG